MMDYIRRFSLIIIPLFCFIFITSCGSNKLKDQSFKFSYCSSENSYHQDNFVMDTLSSYPNISSSNLSEHNKLMCGVLGISREVNEILVLKKDSSMVKRQQVLELKKEVAQRISLAKTELDAIISELDCEGERADLAAAYLDDINSARDTKLTVGSVIIGALTTVAVAIIKNDGWERGIGVGGGLISAGLGALTINHKGKRIEFYHPKNVLTPVWKESDNKEYPNFIWNIFKIDDFNSEEGGSLLESTKKRWVRYVLKEEISKETETLFFGLGGAYTAEELDMRSEMLDQIKSSTRYINQLLSTFESDLYREYKRE